MTLLEHLQQDRGELKISPQVRWQGDEATIQAWEVRYITGRFSGCSYFASASSPTLAIVALCEQMGVSPKYIEGLKG